MASTKLLAAMRKAGLVPVLLSAGCVNSPTIPEPLGVPQAPESKIYPVAVKATAAIDCMSVSIQRASAELKRAGVEGKRTMTLGLLNNDTVGVHTAIAPKVGKTDVPLSLRPFVRNALGRISAFRVMDDPPATGKDAGKEGVVIPPLRLDGSIYFVSPHRVVSADAEALGFGARAKVDAYDIGIQLFWSMLKAKSQTFEQVGTPVAMTVRVFSAEQGSTAFRITSGSNGLLMGNSNAQQEVSLHYAIQEAVNLGVTALVASFAGEFWGIAPSCKIPLVVAWEQDESKGPVVDVTLKSTATQVCARVTDRGTDRGNDRSNENNRLLQEPAQMKVTEWRSNGVPIAERSVAVEPLSKLIAGRRWVCIDKVAFNERTEHLGIEFLGSRSGDRVLGGSTLYLQ